MELLAVPPFSAPSAPQRKQRRATHHHIFLPAQGTNQTVAFPLITCFTIFCMKTNLTTRSSVLQLCRELLADAELTGVLLLEEVPQHLIVRLLVGGAICIRNRPVPQQAAHHSQEINCVITGHSKRVHGLRVRTSNT